MNTHSPRVLEQALSLHASITGKSSGDFQRQIAERLHLTMCQAYDDVRNGREHAPLYAFPAPTGSGKSTYAAALVAAMASADPSYSAAIACNTIEEAHSTHARLQALGVQCEEIYIYTSEHSDRDEKGVQERQLAKRASANHAGLKQARIAVCTHELLLREHRLGIDLGILRHDGIHRANILIDEYPAIVSDYTMAPSDLKHLGEQLSRLNEWDGVRKLFQSVENRVQALFEKDGGRAEKVEIVSREEYQSLAALDRSGLGNTSDAERVGNTLRFLDAASRGQCFLYRGTGKRTASIRQAREFHAFDRSFTVSPGMIILDATFDVSPMRKLFKRVEVIEVPQVNYRNLHITYIEAPEAFADIAKCSTSRAVDNEYASFVRRTVLDNTLPGDSALVIVQKRVEERTPSFSDPATWKSRNVFIAHWGAGIGANQWRDCTHVFAFSEYHKPSATYISEAYGLAGDPLCADRIRTEACGSRRKGHVARAELGHRLRWWKQMACRGRVRQIDSDGVCGPMRLFTTMDKGLLLEHFRALFPGAPQPTFVTHSDAKRKTIGAKLVDYVIASNATKLCASQIAEALEIEVKKVQRVFTSAKAECLRYEGWEFIPGNGKASTPYLTKTPIHINIPGGPCLTI